MNDVSPVDELPCVTTPLPGPKSAALFARFDRHLTSSNADHSMYPLLEVGKRGYLIEDADGNTYADHMSAWGASPLGPTPAKVKQAMESTWDRHGMQISGWLPNTAALELGE